MRAVAVVEPNKVEVVEIGKPAVGPYQALVKAEVAALCNATDGKLVSGHFPGVEDYPLILGHEAAGIVEAVGDKLGRLLRLRARQRPRRHGRRRRGRRGARLV